MQNNDKKAIPKYSDTKYYSCDCSICFAMKKAEEENRELSHKELLEAFNTGNKSHKVVKLNSCLKKFLAAQKGKSKIIYGSCREGLQALEEYLACYDGYSTNGRTSGVDIYSVDPGTIDYLLSYFLILSLRNM